MKYLKPVLACFVVCSLSQAANAQSAGPTNDGVYVSVYGGGQYIHESDVSNNAGLDNIEWDLGYRLGAAVGFRTGQLRVEGELGYRASDGELNLQNGFVFVGGADGDTELSILQGSVNAFYDIADLPMGAISSTPYVGAGLGFANAEIESDIIDDDETGIVLLFEAGMAINLAPNFAIVPAYRFDLLGIEIGDDDAILSHGLQLGARLSF